MSAPAPLASLDEVIARARAAWRPPPKLTLSQWADEHFRLSVESSAQPGRWTTLPYQVEPMNCMSDPLVTDVTVMKSARIGYTLMISAAIGYFVDQDPCSILFVEPTVEDVKSFSKETIAPMIRDVPRLAAIMEDEAEEKGPRDSGNTIQGKTYPGGRLSLVGANSGAGFRRRSCRVAMFDEVDAYPASAGSDGDPVKLGKKRTEYFWNRKHFAGSTPLVAGLSRIEALFLAGDQRRYFVPCPHCGAMDHLVFRQSDKGGHYMVWPDDKPELAHFVCSANGCVIEHSSKRDMVERGEWHASKPFEGHASFHIWAAYSYSPNATWGQIAAEFIEARRTRETLRTFVNTTLGETWTEAGEAPDWERLYRRREEWQLGTVPAGVKVLTCGVDVQKDRWVYEVVGWGEDKQSWSIDAGVIPGNTSDSAAWVALDELLSRRYEGGAGLVFAIRMLGVDSGYNTQEVYHWVRQQDRQRVIALKGSSTAQAPLIGPPTDVDVLRNGKRFARGCKVWPVGGATAKTELYGWLQLEPALETGEIPPGFCHFPMLGPEFFRQLTAEHLVSTTDRKGYTVHEWQKIPGRENHWLDCRVYARAVASVLGLDRARPRVAPPVPVPVVAAALAARPPAAVVAPPPLPKPKPSTDSRFLGKRSGWLSKR